MPSRIAADVRPVMAASTLVHATTLSRGGLADTVACPGGGGVATGSAGLVDGGRLGG